PDPTPAPATPAPSPTPAGDPGSAPFPVFAPHTHDNGAGAGVTDVRSDTVYVNGIHARTGEPLVKSQTIAAWAGELRGRGLDVPQEVRASVQAARFRAFGLPDTVDPNDLRQAGWGVVVPEGRKQQLLDALKPLLDHRRATVPPDRLKLLTYTGESCREWLRQQGMAFGSQKPTIVPYHLLLAGTPEEISFEFQYLLDLEYSVGRLSFDDLTGFTAYSQAVVKTETAGTSRARKAVWFAPRHDPATVLSHDELVKPLMAGDSHGTAGYANVPLLAAEATRANLLKSLAQEQPALLFTASHGLGLDRGDPEQRALQGALLTADWSGSGPAGADKCLAGQHVQVDVSGMVAFLFACYGAGTPLRDDYRKDLTQPPEQIADGPFVAALPQALLANGALAVIGHVERAWGCSIRPAGVRGDLLGPFRNLLSRILLGRCVGNATRDFSDRSAVLSHELLELLRTDASNVDDQTLVWNWVERNDARSYVTLGDPAVRLQ
ncbi:MAG TPA: hypothetical protein VGR35_07595, partial [Tepidisphaeraceae bacterium]|nr:hypothetical protein [Tepidisphaeraceae bacterium]